MAKLHRLAPLLLVVAACSEPTAVKVTPTDRFAVPATLAIAPVEGGGRALLVASGNYDLKYDGATGGTVLSVDPAEAADGGSAAAGGGALVKRGGGEGARVGSYAGDLVVADAATCPVRPGDPARAPEVLLATRFADQIWRLPLGLDGSMEPCSGPHCVVPLDPKLKDPFGVTLACRPDGLRRTAFVSYLRTAPDVFGNAGFLAEVDLDDPASPSRLIAVGPVGLGEMAYDGRTDRLYVLAKQVLSANVYLVNLRPCPDGLGACEVPDLSSASVYDALPGVEPHGIALSNHQDGLGRRAYVAARVYDPVLAALLQGRPSGDVAGVLMVLDLEEGVLGRPSFTVLRIVPIGLGAGQIRVLPVRAPAGTTPRRDLVVASSGTDGSITVYDDEEGAVARVVSLDPDTGAPEAGRGPFGLAVERLTGAAPTGDVARVYVAAARQNVVGIIDVPLDSPGQAHALRDAAGTLIRIGGLQ